MILNDMLWREMKWHLHNHLFCFISIFILISILSKKKKFWLVILTRHVSWENFSKGAIRKIRNVQKFLIFNPFPLSQNFLMFFGLKPLIKWPPSTPFKMLRIFRMVPLRIYVNGDLHWHKYILKTSLVNRKRNGNSWRWGQ